MLKKQATLKSGEVEVVSPLHEGKEIEGRVIEKGQSVIYLDLSPWGTGVIYKGEMRGLAQDVKKIKINDIVKAKVIALENEDGFVELSLKEIKNQKAWETLIEKFKNKQEVRGLVVAANKGGLMIEAEGVKGFLPASQLAIEHYPRVENGQEDKILRKLQKLIGEILNMRIIDIDDTQQKLILSEKAAHEDELKNVLANFKVGDIIDGEITGVVSFGAFVKFGDGLEGLIHISELDWKLIEQPKEVVKIGDKIKAKIIDISGTQVSLSMKALKENPWLKAAEKYKFGQDYKGIVTKLNPYGAFVYLDKDIHGLAHISQFGSREKMERMLEVGREYLFKITSMRPESHRMSLKLVSQKEAVKTREEKGKPLPQPSDEIIATQEKQQVKTKLKEKTALIKESVQSTDGEERKKKKKSLKKTTKKKSKK